MAPLPGAFLVLEWRIRLRSRLNRLGSPLDRCSRGVVYLTVTAGLVGAFVLASDVHGAAITAARWPLLIIGLLLMAAGIVIRQWAVALLGQFFTTDIRVHADQTVVESGPYRWVRHPSYMGMLLTFAGIGLALGNWAVLAVLLVLPTVGLVLRIRVEERALLEGLGKPCRRFAASRARLIPHVWSDRAALSHSHPRGGRR